jgi:hypothetical protein
LAWVSRETANFAVVADAEAYLAERARTPRCWLPTHKQIAVDCKQIQATWSNAERTSRMRCDERPLRWHVAMLATAKLPKGTFTHAD